MPNILNKISPYAWITILFILSFGSSGLLYWKQNNDIKDSDLKFERIRARLVELEDNISSTTSKLSGDITNAHNSLSNALSDEKKNVGSLQQQLGEYKKQVGDVSTSVTTLQKLSKTDPELLAKYSKVFFLNENYAPSRLVEIPNEYVYSDKRTYKIGVETWPHLKELIDAAKKSDQILYIFSAYRSFNEQQALKGAYSVTYGAGSANTFSADQGYSEHQLGTSRSNSTRFRWFSRWFCQYKTISMASSERLQVWLYHFIS